MFKPFLLGGVASIAAEFGKAAGVRSNVPFILVLAGTFPIDTTKTRLQIQGQRSDGAPSRIRYRGMVHALLSISQEEGVKALYSG